MQTITAQLLSLLIQGLYRAMWKKVSSRLNQPQPKSLHSFPNYQSGKCESEPRLNCESIINSPTLARGSRQKQIDNQKLKRSRSQLEIPMLKAVLELDKSQDMCEEVKNMYNSDKQLPGRQERTSSLTKAAERPAVSPNIKQYTNNLLEAVMEMKAAQHNPRHDQKHRAVTFEQPMQKKQAGTSQQPIVGVESALGQIGKYRAKAGEYEERRASILRSYGLSLAELI